MPRKPRFNLPGLPQHVIQRGNNREPCFYSTADYGSSGKFVGNRRRYFCVTF